MTKSVTTCEIVEFGAFAVDGFKADVANGHRSYRLKIVIGKVGTGNAVPIAGCLPDTLTNR